MHRPEEAPVKVLEIILFSLAVIAIFAGTVIFLIGGLSYRSKGAHRRS